MDEKYYNTLYAENRGQLKAINQRKNEILRMKPSPKKQLEWNKNFTPLARPDDSYLLGNIF